MNKESAKEVEEDSDGEEESPETAKIRLEIENQKRNSFIPFDIRYEIEKMQDMTRTPDVSTESEKKNTVQSKTISIAKDPEVSCFFILFFKPFFSSFFSSKNNKYNKYNKNKETTA